MIDLIQGDCLEYLKGLPDNSVDLVVTDPPYDINATGKGIITKRNIKYVEQIQGITKGFDDSVLPELERVLKGINLYIFCSHNQIIPLLDYFVKERNCFYTILSWHKSNPLPTCNNTYLKDTEYCLFFRERGVPIYGTYHTKFTYYVTGINQTDKAKYGHPTIKPLPLIQNYVLNSSKEGDVVLDPFMGSGTTGVACINTNRSFIGVEIDSNYYNIAQNRIKEAEQEKDNVKLDKVA